MSELAHFRRFARYNSWMNEKIYAAAARLTDEEIARDRGAFFSSILGTLNHLVVADTIWLQRIADVPALQPMVTDVAALDRPSALNQILYDSLPALATRRQTLDVLFHRLADLMDDAALSTVVDYRRGNGERRRHFLGDLLIHIFNHQAHHRGQVTTLLSQAGVDAGGTDILALMEPAA